MAKGDLGFGPREDSRHPARMRVRMVPARPPLLPRITALKVSHGSKELRWRVSRKRGVLRCDLHHAEVTERAGTAGGAHQVRGNVAARHMSFTS